MLVVTDQNIIRAGWTKAVTDSPDTENLCSAVFPDVTPDPPGHKVMEGTERYCKAGFDAIVAIGGSPAGCARGIGTVLYNR